MHFLSSMGMGKMTKGMPLTLVGECKAIITITLLGQTIMEMSCSRSM